MIETKPFNWTRNPDLSAQAYPDVPGPVLTIAGGAFHLCAFEVRTIEVEGYGLEPIKDSEETLVPVDPQLRDEVEALYVLEGEDTPQAQTLPGLNGLWLVCAVPFAE